MEIPIASTENKIKLSVIIPVFNEASNLIELVPKTISILTNFKIIFELIFIDDGSTDSSYSTLKELADNRQYIKIIHFRRNFGQTAAMAAGIDFSSGEIIVFMDADLQNDPSDIPLLLEKINEGYDIVSGWRKNRKDSISKTIPSKIANRIIKKIGGVKINDIGCSLKAYKSDVLKEIKLYGEMHRFVPLIAVGMGAKIAEIEVNHHSRKHGQSKYNLNRTFKVMFDLLTVKFMISYGTKPLYVYGIFAIICLLLSFFSGLSVIFMKVVWQTDMTGNPFLLLTVLFILITILLTLMGIQSEIITRIYHQSGTEKSYFVKETINF